MGESLALFARRASQKKVSSPAHMGPLASPSRSEPLPALNRPWPEQRAPAVHTDTRRILCKGKNQNRTLSHATLYSAILSSLRGLLSMTGIHREPAGSVVTSTTAVRLWSLHPSALDRAGLLALWREGLLAQKVLLGQTKGYRFHPQLERFRASKNPVAAISTYLWAVIDEATARGYNFDASKIAMGRRRVSISVTQGQLEFEFEHSRRKLRVRDRARLRILSTMRLKPHPMLRVIPGDAESWELV